MNSKKVNTIWVEQYRPVDLSTFIGNEHLKDKVHIYLESGDLPHLLLFGPAGTGKTSVSKILKDTIECDAMYVNASDKGGVDFIRSEVIPFASSVGFKDLKVIVLDECLDENTVVVVLRNGVDQFIPIKDVDENNDLVKSYNFKTNRIEYRPFYLWDKGKQDVYEIELENGEVVICTADHKWYVEDKESSRQVVKTSQLHKYSYILSPYKIQIKSITKLKQKRHVYDLSVEGNHNFYIGKTQTLTHNCDFLTPQSQAALRNAMETFSKTTRFILTCNYVERVIDPIQSRCQIFQVIPPSRKEIAIHTANILTKENISFKHKDVALIVNSGYPDIRRIINSVQRQSVGGVLSIDRQSLIENDYKLKLLDILKKQDKKNAFQNIRQLLANSQLRDYSELYKLLYDTVDNWGKGHIAGCILELAEGQNSDALVVDREICFMATMIRILNVIK